MIERIVGTLNKSYFLDGRDITRRDHGLPSHQDQDFWLFNPHTMGRLNGMVRLSQYC